MGIPGPMARAGEGVDIPDLMARAGRGGYPRAHVWRGIPGPMFRRRGWCMLPCGLSEDVPNLPQTPFVDGRNNFFELIWFHLFVAGGVGKSALTIQLIQNQ